MLNINYVRKEQVQLGLLLQRVQGKASFSIRTIKAIKKKTKITHPADGPFRMDYYKAMLGPGAGHPDIKLERAGGASTQPLTRTMLTTTHGVPSGEPGYPRHLMLVTSSHPHKNPGGITLFCS